MGLFGIDVAGLGPSGLAQARRTAHAGVVARSQARSCTLDLELAGDARLLDPAYAAHTAPIVRWASAVWDGVVAAGVLHWTLRAAWARLSEQARP